MGLTSISSAQRRHLRPKATQEMLLNNVERRDGIVKGSDEVGYARPLSAFLTSTKQVEVIRHTASAQAAMLNFATLKVGLGPRRKDMSCVSRTHSDGIDCGLVANELLLGESGGCGDESHNNRGEC